ncbi:MAG: sigma-54-dependent Fis family transcriptional regulator [Deltaproteobacteria bacterium]|nr:sigma-54-dependent Fis family transcriptional regulator [Deltaproteobacteria bacterium]
MPEPARVLIVDDEPLMRIPLADRLRSEGYSVDAVGSGEEAVQRFERADYDVAVVDLRLPGIDGVEVLTRVRRLGRTADVVLITAYGTIETAVAAMKIGARDYLIKPFETNALLEVIGRYVKVRRASADDAPLPGAENGMHGMIGASPPMAKLFRLVKAAAEARATIIIQGETGTGKELVARAIHGMSARAAAPFVAINCASIPESLFESELFGAERGAFTGADRRRKGRFELASGGTLFLDEVDEMPLPPQAKLLRAIQERVIERLGGVESLKIDVRIVAATKVDLRGRVAEHRFREDLFHRLNVLPIQLPPLRERGDDVTMLANHFLRLHGAEAGKAARVLSERALSWLQAQTFPGNVRELSNLLARAVALCPSDTIEPWHLAAELEPAAPTTARGSSLADTVRESEMRRIQEALAATGGHKGRAAELLGISRKTLWEKLRGQRS